MPFDWRDFLVLAGKLQEDDRESAQRASLGRSYYFVFHLGLKTAQNRYFTGTLPGLHRKLWDWCQKHEDGDFKELGILGNRLKFLRIQADYYNSPIANLPAEVKRQLHRARKFEEVVAQIVERTAPPAIVV